MNMANLFDFSAAAIVVGGTALATALRCGPGGLIVAVRALAHLVRPRFDADGARAEMAAQVREIDEDGLLRAHAHHFGDSEFDEVAETLIGARSVKALLARHEAHRDRRMAIARRASATLAQAAELAPVFGMVGTLISLSQLPAGGVAAASLGGAISMAVLTTLYGLLLANLLLAPLSRAIDRAAAEEEGERQQIVDWLASHVERSLPGGKSPAADRTSDRASDRARDRAA